ncbi:MAG: hypothetical protein P4M11_01000 [Candidatus Pacebacteria bacterium]|nr:hypothetical protein [Candidatus Paceibacterota bacterium]
MTTLGEESGLGQKVGKLVEDVIRGHFQQKARDLRGKVDGAIVGLGDKCACLDIGEFSQAFKDKYDKLLKLLTDSIYSAYVFVAVTMLL